MATRTIQLDLRGAAKPARESRTLRFNRQVSWLVSALAALPTLASFVLEQLGDPAIAAAVADAVPGRYRAALAVIVLVVAQRNRALRLQTSTPIAGEKLSRQQLRAGKRTKK